MQKALQVKFLNFLNSRKQADEGFTLIELLVVIIIIGILAAIALPSLLGQANKAKQSEARNNVGALVRGQQSFALEASRFTTDIVTLGLGIQTSTTNYNYIMRGNVGTGDAAADRYDAVAVYGVPKNVALKGYVGVAATGFSDPNNPAASEVTTVTVVCESNQPWSDNPGDANALLNATAPPTALGNAAASTTCTGVANLIQADGWKALGQ
ncbi:MAG: prepilin-type N-terminal cleavage/methylation domain-containing protein [Spirulina sp. SIO3F2]|nr:prepilin-type N-terminal cleavage/methylation domain-containing protein [Spirulina sp. SIO3F2]